MHRCASLHGRSRRALIRRGFSRLVSILPAPFIRQVPSWVRVRVWGALLRVRQWREHCARAVHLCGPVSPHAGAGVLHLRADKAGVHIILAH